MANKSETITITPPNFRYATFRIQGNAPYVQNKFSERAKEDIIKKQEAGAKAKKGAKKEPKDFDALYQEAIHFSRDGWAGIPASAFRNAMVSACRTVNFTMTLAKLCVFVEADGYDAHDSTPLIRITKGEPHREDHAVRIQRTIDIKPFPVWDPGWEALVRLRYDADFFSLQDITNLLMRVGMQVGIGAGRPDSKDSTGMGWGTFEIVSAEEIND